MTNPNKKVISADWVGRSTKKLSQLQRDGDTIYWLEQRPEEAGRGVVMQYHNNYIGEVTAPDFNVRSRVHEYGGGDYCVQQKVIYFVNNEDQQIYRQLPGESAQQLTEAQIDTRYADLTATTDNRFLFAVEEIHPLDQPIINQLVVIDTTTKQKAVIASGADFYSYPRLNHSNNLLAFTCWRHPNMPWDHTKLWIAEFDQDKLTLVSPKRIAGEQVESVNQPQWGEHDQLYFVSDRNGWWNLYQYDENTITPINQEQKELAAGQWNFAMQFYTELTNDRFAWIAIDEGETGLYLTEKNKEKPKKIALTLNELEPSIASDQQFIYVIASNYQTPAQIIRIDIDSLKTETLYQSGTAIDASYLSKPQAIQFATSEDDQAHAYFYPAQTDTSKPTPLLVISHGGPTAACSSAYNLKIQYWTSHGFSVVDVNYRGSTGYGRAYRDRLKQNWGIFDVADCVHAANYLVDQGLVDPTQLFIRGGSAGGFTTLCALTFYDMFSAGASYYGVSDLNTLLTDTHKFEAHYLDSMVGPYPEMATRYNERSPVYHAEKITCPIIFLQGMQDKVVPPEQAEIMIKALKKNQVAYEYVTFENEGHGFRQAENMSQALESERAFYMDIEKS